MQDIYIGQMLDNRYEILEKIGTGGMAIVYKALCHRLNRLVAIKILKDELAQDVEFRKRFYAESQAVAMLSHPNIVAVYDVSHSNNTDYIVMELIEGITLKQYITRKGSLGWKEALHFSTQIIKALQHAHSRGIIHRDIKPQNIMILKDGSVKVADFGIARLLTTPNTLTQEALGSVHYMSPEQAKGSAVDARSDIYSVGVVMYEMITGRLPFEGESAVSVAIQHISSIPLMPREANPSIPFGLEAITMHAMEASLVSRYTSADEMLHDLEEFRKNPDIIFDYSDFPAVTVSSDEATRVLPSNSPAILEAKPAPKRSTTWTSSHVTKEEYARNRRRTGRTTVLVGIFGVGVVLIALFIFMWNYFLKDMLDPEDVRVAVPNFVGQQVESVLKDKEYTQHFVFTVEEQYSEEKPAGEIMSQDPTADRQISLQTKGINVKLLVSKGPEIIYMPDLINTDHREAKIQLESLKLNLTFVIDSAPDESVTVGYVIDQRPLEGEQLFKGGTVYLTYSSGPEIVNITMPDVMGLTEAQAISRLESYDLSHEITYDNDETQNGLVIFQSYQVGDQVPIHTKVTLIVSLGPLQVPPSENPDDGDPDTGTEGEDPEVTDTPPETSSPNSPDPGLIYG